MELISYFFTTIFFNPIVNLLVAILRGLEFLHIPGALGFAIMILTIVIRVIIWPFMAAQLKSSKKMNDLKPKLDELKRKHKDDKQAMSAAQMQLYKEHGINPASGCLPAIIQIPIVIALYQVILAIFEGAHGLTRINNALYFPDWHLLFPPDPYFLGLNLGSKPSEFATVGVLVLLVPLVTALLQFIQSKMMAPAPVKEYPNDSKKEVKEKEKSDDAMAAMQGQMLFLMPIMIGYFAFSFPVGLAIYWNTFTILGIIQQYMVSGWGNLTSLLPLKKG